MIVENRTLNAVTFKTTEHTKCHVAKNTLRRQWSSDLWILSYNLLFFKREMIIGCPIGWAMVILKFKNVAMAILNKPRWLLANSEKAKEQLKIQKH